MFIGDVGGSQFEEVNIGQSGANYGWPIAEGTSANPAFVNPIHTYPHGASASITGGYVYRGETDGLNGQYFFADFPTGKVFTLRFDGSNWVATERTSQIPTDVGTIDSRPRSARMRAAIFTSSTSTARSSGDADRRVVRRQRHAPAASPGTTGCSAATAATCSTAGPARTSSMAAAAMISSSIGRATAPTRCSVSSPAPAARTGSASPRSPSIGSLADVLSHATQVNADTVIDFGGGDTLTLRNVVRASLSGDDFVLASPGDNSFTVTGGNQQFDAGIGFDTITFGFRLVDATVTHAGNSVTITGPSSQTVLTGFERFVFTDGAVDNNDGNRLVDDLFYYAKYHDVWNAHADADAHYNSFGGQEGRDPNAFFSTASTSRPIRTWARRQSAGAFRLDRLAGRTPAVTQFRSRAIPRRQPRRRGRACRSAAALSDVRRPGGTAAARADRVPQRGRLRLRLLPVAQSGRRGDRRRCITAFPGFGWHEGRNPNALFDINGYLATYTDVAAANANPLDHYNMFGWHEGRDPSVAFDTTSYLAAYPDVAAAGINPLQHYLQFGVHEGRSAFADGVWG